MTTTSATRRTVVGVIMTVAFWTLAPHAGAAGASSAQTEDPAGAATTIAPRSATTLDPDEIGPGALGDIVPEPGSGREPRLEGERGTRSQLVAFVALAGGVALVGSLAARDIRRGRARRDARAAATTGGDPQAGGQEPVGPDGAPSTRSDPVADSSTNPPSSSALQ